jgi:hypothetical protein
MTKYKSRFEDLPNELLTDIFKNLDARNLFRTFHNLNARLNQLIQSFQYLQLVFHINQSNLLKSNDEIFSYYVHTLIVDPWINVNLTQFPNVHRLQLDNPLPEILGQLKPEIMPYLEHLSVRYMFNMYEMDLLRDKIFSNRFLHLRSCELLEEKSLMTRPNCSQSPLINILKTELIDSVVYQTILSACPNLYFLKFSMYPLNGMPTNISFHENLKRMIIDYQESDWFYADDHILSGFLACVPNLEILEIHRKIRFQNLQQHFEQYDWLASIIHFHLPRLRKLKHVIHLFNDKILTETIDENILIQIQKNFNDVHKGQYKAQLEIRRESLDG